MIQNENITLWPSKKIFFQLYNPSSMTQPLLRYVEREGKREKHDKFDEYWVFRAKIWEKMKIFSFYILKKSSWCKVFYIRNFLNENFLIENFLIEKFLIEKSLYRNFPFSLKKNSYLENFLYKILYIIITLFFIQVQS